MKTIFNDLKDLQVRKFVVYGKKADHKLYYDAAYTEQVLEVDVADAFDKGMLQIVDTTGINLPVFRSGANVYTVGTKNIAESSQPANEVANLVEWYAKAAE